MDSRWLGVIVLIIIVALGGWYVFANPVATPVPVVETPPATDQTSTTTTTTTVPAPITVTYTDTGFSPSSVTVTEGQTVTWVNESSRSMWVASAMHPAHTIYDGTNKDVHCAEGYTGAVPFDECAGEPKGESYSFTFTKAGDWKYHNHSNSADFGSVVVTGTPVPTSGVNVTASTSVNVE